MIVREKMNLRKWYSGSIRIPSYLNKDYVSFVSSSIGIVRSIVEERIGKNIYVRFVTGGTASADTETGIIAINEEYLNGVVDGDVRSKLDSDTAISLILGIIVHEAAHFAYSPANLSPWADHIEKNTKCLFHPAVARTLGNVIEDVYIEAEVERKVPSLHWMLDCCNKVFFREENLKDALGEASEIQNAPYSLDAVSSVLNVLIYAKTRELVSTTPYISGLFREVRSATEPSTIAERLNLALHVYELLMQSVGKEPEAAPETEEGDTTGEGAESAGGDGAKKESDEGGEAKGKKSKGGDVESGNSSSSPSSEKSEESLKEVEEASKGLTASHDDREPSIDVTPVSKVIESSLKKLEGCNVTMTEDDGAVGSPTTLFIEKPLASGVPLEIDARYARLAEIGRQRAVVNRPYGMDSNRGSSIRKLYRIATDQKIFASPLAMGNYRPMQVVILVDCSGSMNLKYGSSTRLKEALRAALGAAYGLVDAQCEVAVYGHTADLMRGTDVTLYKAKGFGESISGLAGRLGYLLSNERTAQNRDGYAIQYIAKKFTSHTKRRLLIVISDGEPAAPNYQGREAIYHTRDVVNAVRKTGVDVLSISITGEARESNNQIYGKANNVFNSDPNVIAEVIKSLITK